MDNIIGYAHTFKHSFDEKPFSEVDSLILSQLSYLRYENCGLCQPARVLQLGSLAAEMHNQDLLHNVPAKNRMLDLMYAVATNPRFKWLLAAHYATHTDAEMDKQFSAITYVFEDGTIYVAYRGTDGSMTGWKENFNMTYLPVVPSQAQAVDYLQTVSSTHEGSIYAGGHSKGGNLAVYASAHSPTTIQDRIVSVYSHDGPGFQKEFFEEDGYLRIASRIQKTVPESAIVGMLLAHQEAYNVIESTEHGILQHRAFTWVVRDGQFSHRARVRNSARRVTDSFNAWTDTLDVSERKAIVDALFQIVGATNAQTVKSLAFETIRNAPGVVRAVSKIPPEKKQMFLDKLMELERMIEQSEDENPA